MPGMHGRVLALLTLLFVLRVLGQALVEFFTVDWLPSSEAWASGLIPYPILLAIQLVMLIAMVKIASDVWRQSGFFLAAPASWSRLLIGCSAVYAGSMAARYILTMILRPEMRWLGDTIPIFFHFVLAAFLYTWGKFLARRSDICKALTRMLKTGLTSEVGMDFQQLADKALQGIIPERAELKAVLDATDEQLPELLSAAFKVRHHYYGKRVQIHVLQNAKSGLCPEDCHYCSQSSVSEAPIDRYPFMSKEKLIEGAKAAKAAGAVRYCIVNSGRGPTNKEIDEIADAVRAIRSETGMNVCCSLGLMNQDKTERLKAAGRRARQSQFKHQSRASPRDRHYPHLRRPCRNHRECQTRRDRHLFRWHHRHGRERRRHYRSRADAQSDGHRLDPGEFFKFDSDNALRKQARAYARSAV